MTKKKKNKNSANKKAMLAALINNQTMFMNKTSAPPAPAQFSSFAFPLIRAAFPGGRGFKHSGGEVDLTNYDFEPIVNELKNSKQDYETVYELLKKHNCNKPGVITLLIELGCLTKVKSEADFYSDSTMNSLVDVQPMTMPTAKIFSLNYTTSNNVTLK